MFRRDLVRTSFAGTAAGARSLIGADPLVNFADTRSEATPRVPVDRSCNRDKRDFLAATEHVLRWVERNRHGSPSPEALIHIAQQVGMETHPAETLGATRAIHTRLPDQARPWKTGKEFVAPDRASLMEALR